VGPCSPRTTRFLNPDRCTRLVFTVRLTEEFRRWLGDIARPRGMAQIAKDSGLVFTFAILDPVLAIGAYVIWRREVASRDAST